MRTLCAGYLSGYILFWIPSHYLGNDTEVVFSSSLPGFAALKLFPTLLRLQYRHKKVGYFMVFQTPKVDFTVSFATLPLLASSRLLSKKDTCRMTDQTQKATKLQLQTPRETSCEEGHTAHTNAISPYTLTKPHQLDSIFFRMFLLIL